MMYVCTTPTPHLPSSSPQHCQVGWETAQPATIPPQPSISLKSFPSDHTSKGNLHCPSDHTHMGADPSPSGHTHKGNPCSSRSLLNASHSMHYGQLARGGTNVLNK